MDIQVRVKLPGAKGRGQPLEAGRGKGWFSPGASKRNQPRTRLDFSPHKAHLGLRTSRTVQ